MSMHYRALIARLGIVMLLYLCGMAPVHLVEEIHAMLPASGQHHTEIHCENQSACNKPQDDISKPLTGEEHERHHEAQCANDGMFSFMSGVDVVKVAATSWTIVTLEFPAVDILPLLELPASELHCRPPPERGQFLTSLTYSVQSGRAPPATA